MVPEPTCTGCQRGMINDPAGTFDLAACSIALRKKGDDRDIMAWQQKWRILHPSPLGHRLSECSNSTILTNACRWPEFLQSSLQKHPDIEARLGERKQKQQRRIGYPVLTVSDPEEGRKEEGWEALGDLISLGSLFDMMGFVVTEVRSEKAG